VVILRPVRNLWLVEKRFRQSITGLNQTVQRMWIKGVTDNEETVLVKRLSLLRFELNKVQNWYPSSLHIIATRCVGASCARTVAISIVGKAVILDLGLQL